MQHSSRSCHSIFLSSRYRLRSLFRDTWNAGLLRVTKFHIHTKERLELQCYDVETCRECGRCLQAPGLPLVHCENRQCWSVGVLAWCLGWGSRLGKACVLPAGRLTSFSAPSGPLFRCNSCIMCSNKIIVNEQLEDQVAIEHVRAGYTPVLTGFIQN
jgi:hypothetical protein